jgi:hypothetical protein
MFRLSLLSPVVLLGVSSLRSDYASAPSSAYVPTPVGWMLRSCVNEVPSGSVLTSEEGGRVLVTPPSSAVSEAYYLPPCVGSESEPIYLPHGLAPRNSQKVGGGGVGGRNLQLPPDYKGWVEYANVTSPDMQTGFEAFTSVFTTPSTLPAQVPDELFLFPGLQNIDWIPLVDPEPKAAFDIIQPVIQYPADGGNHYSVKSWWVTLDMGAAYSPELALEPGDAIFGNMTKTGASAWYIDSVNMRTGESTHITASGLGPRLKNQPWAYVTLECYGCSSCSTYPSGNSSSSFEDMLLTTVAGKPFSPSWQANAKPDPNKFCHESIELINASNVNIYFDRTA